MSLAFKPETSSGILLKFLIQGYLLTHQTEGRSRNTIEYYSGILHRFLWYAKKQAWPEDSRLLDEWHIRDFLGYILSQNRRWDKVGNGSESSSRPSSSRTVHHYYSALRAFFNWAIREGFLVTSPLTKVKVAKAKARVIQPYSDEQIKKLIKVCDYDYQTNAKFLGSRNRAIILILLDSGLRLSEAANIKVTDIEVDKGWIKVIGKGNKERIVRIGKSTQKALWRYLLHRGDNLYSNLWLTEEREPMRNTGIQSVIGRLKKRAGICDSGSVHKFRHTFAVNFLRQDRNPFNLQYLLGHNSLEMVKRYTATLGMEDALKAHEKASPVDILGLK